jgi:hypothetical protein
VATARVEGVAVEAVILASLPLKVEIIKDALLTVILRASFKVWTFLMVDLSANPAMFLMFVAAAKALA